MRSLIIGVLALSLSAGCLADTRLSNGSVLSDKPTWIVTYIEVAAESADAAAALIVTHTVASREDTGNLRFEGLQRIERSNHFAILEAWTDPQSRAAHAASVHTRAFREALQPMLIAPYDERLHVGLAATAPDAIPNGSDTSIYVLTHADIIPPEQFAPCRRRPDPAGPCGNDLLINLAEVRRGHAGNLRFDVLTQSSRANHMTVVEMWDSASAQAAHEVSPDTRHFRDRLAGIEAGSGVNPDSQFVLDMLTGSLWDERLYRLIGRPLPAAQD